MRGIEGKKTRLYFRERKTILRTGPIGRQEEFLLAIGSDDQSLAIVQSVLNRLEKTAVIA